MMNARKTYYFSSPTYGWFPELTVIDGSGQAGKRRPSMTPATYQRFVDLANSGDYSVEIQPVDCGVAWELRRKDAKPAPDAQDFYSEADYFAACAEWERTHPVVLTDDSSDAAIAYVAGAI